MLMMMLLLIMLAQQAAKAGLLIKPARSQLVRLPVGYVCVWRLIQFSVESLYLHWMHRVHVGAC